MAPKKKIYEDRDVVVMVAPRDTEIGELIVEAIEEKGYPMAFDELRLEFSGVVGEDRLRRALNKLINSGILIEFPDGSFGLPGMEPRPDRVGSRKRRRRSRRIYLDIAAKPFYVAPKQ